MATFASTFVNIMDMRQLLVPGEAVTATPQLLAAINQIETVDSSTRRGIVWFPPGIYQIYTGHIIDENITLAFAPGAVLIPIIPRGVERTFENSVIQIKGLIDAGAHEIFATSASFTGSNNVGGIVLTGVGTRRVFPEWWGASRISEGFEPRVDTSAIQAAIVAAITGRERLTGNTLPPVTVYLQGTYVIDRAIIVEPPTDTGVIYNAFIEGASGFSSIPTVRCDTEGLGRFLSPENSMFRFSHVENVSLRGVSFDAENRASICVRFETSLALHQVKHQFAMDDCSWANAPRAQVRIHDSSLTEPGDGVVVAAFKQCRFRGVEARFLSVETRLSGVRHVAIESIGAYTMSLNVTGCVFDGFARRALQVRAGRVDVSGCHFKIIEGPLTSLPNPLATDVEFAPISSNSPRTSSLTVIGCVSNSPSFLRVTPPRQPDGSAASPLMRDVSCRVTLTSVTHVNTVAPQAPWPPPAVIWEEIPRSVGELAPAPLRGSSLSLISCSFNASPSVPDRLIVSSPPSAPTYYVGFFRGQVFIGSQLRTVYNVGSFHEVLDQTRAFIVLDAGIPFRFPVHSLGSAGSSHAPRPVVEDIFLSSAWFPVRTAFAWATWLWE